MTRTAAGTVLLAALLAGSAHADETDPFCASLAQIARAADAATPFGALAPNIAAGQSMGKAQILPGFEEARACSGYMAGTLEKGTVGGGAYNYIECRYFRDDRKSNPDALKGAEAALATLTAKVETCATGLGWKQSAPWPFKERMDLKGTRYATPIPDVDAVVFLESQRIGRSASSANTTYEVRLRIRSMNPNHPHERTD